MSRNRKWALIFTVALAFLAFFAGVALTPSSRVNVSNPVAAAMVRVSGGHAVLCPQPASAGMACIAGVPDIEAATKAMSAYAFASGFADQLIPDGSWVSPDVVFFPDRNYTIPGPLGLTYRVYYSFSSGDSDNRIYLTWASQ